ncbi:prenyltransferase [Flaviflexus salsibiostraticola]|uniref:Prenyltransferase n=1 Tax=Flaviflexus salsibiostraticola TaxID=1282737 RepID=A0A3S8Z8W1_9ACTO|nr:prenyltransferase [Flaviflexus salsibiostraticola]AZN29766.1 prenyltransferase [Flaviflexus salsibiostraticola]
MTPDRSPFREGLANLIGSSRPVSWINTAYPFAAAYLMVGGGITAELIIGTLWFLIPYNLLMYGVNDVFDYESDLRNPRKGGIEGVVLSTRWHRLTLQASVLTNLPFIVALIIMGNALSTVILLISVFAVVAYSAKGLRFKEKPVLDSATSATHFVSPAVFGIALAGAEFTAPITIALIAFFLWGMASQAFGAVQDIQADREGGIASIATWLGARWTVRAAAAAYLLAGLLLLGTGWPGALSSLLVIPYIANVAPYLNLSDEECERANAAWRCFIWLNLLTGFLVTQLFIWIALAF